MDSSSQCAAAAFRRMQERAALRPRDARFARLLSPWPASSNPSGSRSRLRLSGKVAQMGLEPKVGDKRCSSPLMRAHTHQIHCRKPFRMVVSHGTLMHRQTEWFSRQPRFRAAPAPRHTAAAPIHGRLRRVPGQPGGIVRLPEMLRSCASRGRCTWRSARATRPTSLSVGLAPRELPPSGSRVERVRGGARGVGAAAPRGRAVDDLDARGTGAGGVGGRRAGMRPTESWTSASKRGFPGCSGAGPVEPAISARRSPRGRARWGFDGTARARVSAGGAWRGTRAVTPMRRRRRSRPGISAPRGS
jgi:hypothetical protein